jgi:hypothetical protein
VPLEASAPPAVAGGLEARALVAPEARDVDRDGPLLGVSAGEGRHAAAEPRRDAYPRVGPRGGPSVRGDRLRGGVEDGRDRGDALAPGQSPDAEVGTLGVAGRTLELEHLAARLGLERGARRDGKALESRLPGR